MLFSLGNGSAAGQHVKSSPRWTTDRDLALWVRFAMTVVSAVCLPAAVG